MCYNNAVKTLCAVLVSCALAAGVLLESTHFHEHSYDAPCPIACLGGTVMYSADSMAVQLVPPAVPAKLFHAVGKPLFASRIMEDDIFHPPAF